MKLSRILATALLFLTVLVSFPMHAHAQGTQYLIDGQLDAYGNLGYKFPTIDAGLAIERPIGNHFEAQAQIRGGYSPKYITNDGVSLTARAQGVLFLTDNFGVTGGFGTSNLWTSQFVKIINIKQGFDQQAIYPIAGIVVRDQFQGAAGRFYLDYKFATGCEWATASNPCTIQSSRLQGPELYQEFRMTDHIRVGVSFALYHFYEQSNQNAPNIARIGHYAPTASATIRFQLPGRSWAARY